MADTPTPRPLTADTLSTLIDRVDAWCDEWHTTHPIVARDLLYEILGELLVTRAEVDRLTANLATTTSQHDAADAVIQAIRDEIASYEDVLDDPYDCAQFATFVVALLARAAQPQEPT